MTSSGSYVCQLFHYHEIDIYLTTRCFVKQVGYTANHTTKFRQRQLNIGVYCVLYGYNLLHFKIRYID